MGPFQLWSKKTASCQHSTGQQGNRAKEAGVRFAPCHVQVPLMSCPRRSDSPASRTSEAQQISQPNLATFLALSLLRSTYLAYLVPPIHQTRYSNRGLDAHNQSFLGPCFSSRRRLVSCDGRVPRPATYHCLPWCSAKHRGQGKVGGGSEVVFLMRWQCICTRRQTD